MQNADSIRVKTDRFIQYIIENCAKDKGFAALIKRADNPNTEYYSWEILARFTDLTRDSQRLPYAYIAAAIADGKVQQNGTQNIGRVLAKCYDSPNGEGNQEEQAKLRLRRLLACQNSVEACAVLRGLLSLIRARNLAEQLDYAELLKNLIGFNDRVKERWAMAFYRSEVGDE
jgi:CRISPR system Cascade subunit CasB